MVVNSKNLHDRESLRKGHPLGCLFCFRTKADTFQTNDALLFWDNIQFSYLSPSWEKISNVPRDKVMQDKMLPAHKILSDDLMGGYFTFMMLKRSYASGEVFNTEVRYQYSDVETRWYRITAKFWTFEEWVECDGLIFDITKTKTEELELKGFLKSVKPYIQDLFDTPKEESNSVKFELEQKKTQMHNQICALMKKVHQLEQDHFLKKVS